MNYFTALDARKAKLPKSSAKRQQLRNTMTSQLFTPELDKVNAAFNAAMKRHK